MPRIAWITDPHLNFLTQAQVDMFLRSVAAAEPDAVLIGGDIGEGPNLLMYLKQIESGLQRPVYFVLGNHDYYHESIPQVRHRVGLMANDSPHLVYLSGGNVIPLGTDSALIGHDGWIDGRLGNYTASQVMLSDYLLIRELAGLGKQERLERLHTLGDEAVEQVRAGLLRALADRHHVLLLTHIPPFQASCWHEGHPATDDDPFLPHFGSRAMGEALIDIMDAHPDHFLTVLCGHTHAAATVQPRPNLLVLTGSAEYGNPVVQRTFEVE